MTSFIGAHWLAPDATRVLVLAGDDPASPSTLFGVEVDTPTTRDRPDGPAGHQGVDPMVLSPDGVTVAFRGDPQTANLGQVFQAATPGVSARSPDIAGALALAAMPAWAASTLQVEQRTATLAVTAYAGVAVVDANLPCAGLTFPDTFEQCSFDGSLGDPATVQVALTPGRLEIAGSGRADAAESQWAAALMLDWHTWQEHGVANDSGDAVLTGAGGHGSTLWFEVYGPAIAPGTPGTREVRVWNLQNVFFTLDQTTAYTLSGSSFGEYMPLTLARDDGTGVYVGVGLPGITALSPYSFGGVLAAGRYRLSNFDFVQSDFQDSYAYGWAYTMRFHDTVAAVPEPEALVLMTLGLVALRARARRREA